MEAGFDEFDVLWNRLEDTVDADAEAEAALLIAAEEWKAARESARAALALADAVADSAAAAALAKIQAAKYARQSERAAREARDAMEAYQALGPAPEVVDKPRRRTPKNRALRPANNDERHRLELHFRIWRALAEVLGPRSDRGVTRQELKDAGLTGIRSSHWASFHEHWGGRYVGIRKQKPWTYGVLEWPAGFWDMAAGETVPRQWLIIDKQAEA
jgi:hypothetical protein